MPNSTFFDIIPNISPHLSAVISHNKAEKSRTDWAVECGFSIKGLYNLKEL